MKQRIVRVDAPDANDVTLAAIFEPINFRSTATAFRGGTLDLWYGGGIIDLRDAFLDPGGARLDVRAVFGGAQIVVPETWRVTTNVVGLGGIGDGRSKVERPVTAPVLVIDGVAIMGGFGITSELSEQQATAVADAVARRKRSHGTGHRRDGAGSRRLGVSPTRRSTRSAAGGRSRSAASPVRR